jgi:putative ABC transport system permease protein
MQLYDISLKGLRRRLGRMALLLLSLVTAVATVVTLVSITRSLNHAVAHRLDEFGANIVIVPQASDLALSYGGISVGTAAYDVGELTLADLEPIGSIPNARNISVVAPKLLAAVDLGAGQVLMAGVLFSEEVRLKQWWQVRGAYPSGASGPVASTLGGHAPTALAVGRDGPSTEVLLGARLAQTLGLEPGDTLVHGGHTLLVAGVLQETGSQDDDILFVDLSLAQEIAGRPGEISLVEIAALCSDCPVEELVRQIGDVLPQARVSAVRQAVALRMETVGQLTQFALIVSLVVALIGGLIVLTTMLGAVAERRQEIGLFRALGFRRAHIQRVILGEALLISLAGGVLGWLAGMGAVLLLRPTIAELAMESPWDPILALVTLAGALAIGLAGSLYPARRAADLDPTTALRAL